MKIIEPGFGDQLETDRTYCLGCRAVFEFNALDTIDYGGHNTYSGRPHIYVACPMCGLDSMVGRRLYCPERLLPKKKGVLRRLWDFIKGTK